MGKAKILIVDDEPMMLDIFREGFENRGYEVITAENGEIALEKYKLENPDAVVTDGQMPRMNGVELSIEILKINSKALIIMVSGASSIRDQVLSLGVKEFILKPVFAFQVLDVVGELLEKPKECYV